ncbi:MAG: hypothetical protein EZS28_007636 [Streblomastix strix]|uniref:SPRY domain-containing protein n=1 Tax=Streblomastix strix TaxID=222440 RepID=A0A5J4WPR2_9EUKA|nr:MAG: hypothetical protein EZS28_007636 [Streblomastix strix]
MSSTDIIHKIKQLEEKALAAENNMKFEKFERDKEKQRANQLEAENAKLKVENQTLKMELEVMKLRVENAQLKSGLIQPKPKPEYPIPKPAVLPQKSPGIEQQQHQQIDLFESVLSPSFEGPKISAITSPPKTPIITSPHKSPGNIIRPKSPGQQIKSPNQELANSEDFYQQQQSKPKFTMDVLKQKLETMQPKSKKAISPSQSKQQTPKLSLISANPNHIIPSAIMPNKKDCHQEGYRIIHTSQNSNMCVIACNPVISSGIVRFEGFFDNTSNFCMIGIADASVVFEPNVHPGEYKGKTLTYASSNGFLQHLSFPGLMGNAEFANREKIGCEVVMDQKPRRVHFFVEGEEQKNAVVEIPQAIRFLVCIYNPNSSFTLLKFERLQQCTAKGVNGATIMEWGKLWDNP